MTGKVCLRVITVLNRTGRRGSIRQWNCWATPPCKSLFQPYLTNQILEFATQDKIYLLILSVVGMANLLQQWHSGVGVALNPQDILQDCGQFFQVCGPLSGHRGGQRIAATNAAFRFLPQMLNGIKIQRL